VLRALGYKRIKAFHMNEGHSALLSLALLEEIKDEITSLYTKLESVILPMFYQEPRKYANVMRSAIAINGSFFNAQRMMFQYLKNAYSNEEKP